MSRYLLALMALLSLPGAAFGTLIGIRWKDAPTSQTSPPTAPNTPIVLQFYMQNGPNGTNPWFDGVGMILNAWQDTWATSPAGGLIQVSVTSLIPGWSAAPTNRNEHLNALQFAATAGPRYQPPDGDTVIMEITLQYSDPAPPPQYALTIKRKPASADTTSVIFDSTTGVEYLNNTLLWDARPGYADSYGREYWAFGYWGNQGWSNATKSGFPWTGDQPDPNPLVLLTPEPAGLILLTLGTVAAWHRRRPVWPLVREA